MADLVRIGSPGGSFFTVAKPHAERFQGFINDLENSGYKINGDQSGGYNYRTIAGTNKLSNHAHGAAIDVNWTDNARGTPGNIPADLARSLAQKHGLTWGGDWKNPDPMHFEVAGQPGHTYGDGHNHGAPPATTGATPMAAPALSTYDGPSPDDVAMQRKLALSLMQQGTSAEPVGHWTQALARVLQGGIGGMYRDQASEGEKQGRQYTATALAGAMQPGADPTAAIGNLLRAPYGAEIGQKLAGSVIESNLAPTYDFKAAGDNLYRTNRKTGKADVIDAGIKQTPEVQKLIAESDVNIANHRSAIGTINEMLRLNGEAYDGPTASTRAMVMGAVGDKAAQTTQYIENMTKSQALAQLRAIFGGNPTEGERKVLLDVAGSVNQPAAVRQKIWENARNAVEAKMAIEAQRAEQLRNNSYFKPGGGAAAQTTPVGPASALPPQAVPQPQPQSAAPGVSVGESPKPLPSGTYNWSADQGMKPATAAPPQQAATPPVAEPSVTGGNRAPMSILRDAAARRAEAAPAQQGTAMDYIKSVVNQPGISQRFSTDLQAVQSGQTQPKAFLQRYNNAYRNDGLSPAERQVYEAIVAGLPK